MIQLLRLHSQCRASGVLGEGTRSHKPQQRILHATTKDPTYCSEDQRSHYDFVQSKKKKKKKKFQYSNSEFTSSEFKYIIKTLDLYHFLFVLEPTI